jgi:hypothetical protein
MTRPVILPDPPHLIGCQKEKPTGGVEQMRAATLRVVAFPHPEGCKMALNGIPVAGPIGTVGPIVCAVFVSSEAKDMNHA